MVVKCLFCDIEMKEEFIEGEFDNPILFCTGKCRSKYKNKIIDIIIGLKDLDLKKLKEIILEDGLIYAIMDKEE